MPVIDKRELILARLAELPGENYVGSTVVRNRGLVSQDVRPAFALLDGDEKARLTGDRKGDAQMRPQLMTMTPQLFFLPKSYKPGNEGIGQLVNQYRLALIRVIAQDPVLLSLVGSNGYIVYLGFETDLKSGGLLDGQARLDFAFTYVLDPYE